MIPKKNTLGNKIPKDIKLRNMALYIETNTPSLSNLNQRVWGGKDSLPSLMNQSFLLHAEGSLAGGDILACTLYVIPMHEFHFKVNLIAPIDYSTICNYLTCPVKTMP